MDETQSEVKPTSEMSTQMEQSELLSVNTPNEADGGDEPKRDIPDGKWTGALIFAVLAAAFGSSFQFGYQIGGMNIPGDVIKEWFNQSHQYMHNETMTEDQMDLRWTLTNSIWAVAGMFGGVSVGYVADKLGRKKALLFNNGLAVIAAGLMTGAKYAGWYWLFIGGRLVMGLNSGLNSGLAPMYLTEISPANLRGAIGSFAQLFLTIAILFSQILGLPVLLGTHDLWQWIFGFSIVPVIVQLATLPFCPESPKYNLGVRDNKDQAEKDLKKLRDRSDVSAELEQLNDEAVAARAQARVTMMNMFSAPLLWPLVLAMFMMISQQLSGINAAMFYSKLIFKGAGLTIEWSNYATIAMGTINVIMTVVSVYLVDHPKFGRRLLHIGGMGGACFSLAMLTVTTLVYNKHTELKAFSYMSILFVNLFVIFFAVGPGPIPWFYVNELFQSNARGNANSLAVLTNWFFTALVGFTFPYMQKGMEEYCFLVFVGLLILFIVFALKFLPETKNKTLEEVQKEMDRRRGVQTETEEEEDDTEEV